MPQRLPADLSPFDTWLTCRRDANSINCRIPHPSRSRAPSGGNRTMLRSGVLDGHRRLLFLGCVRCGLELKQKTADRSAPRYFLMRAVQGTVLGSSRLTRLPTPLSSSVATVRPAFPGNIAPTETSFGGTRLRGEDCQGSRPGCWGCTAAAAVLRMGLRHVSGGCWGAVRLRRTRPAEG